jgi:hypothetical protein
MIYIFIYFSCKLFRLFIGRAFLKEWTLILYGTSVNPDRRQSKSKVSLPTTNTKSDKPSVPLSTSTPTQDSSVRLILTQSVTKSPVLNIEHNNIDDSEESEEIPLSDSHSKNMLHQGLDHLFDYYYYYY